MGLVLRSWMLEFRSSGHGKRPETAPRLMGHMLCGVLEVLSPRNTESGPSPKAQASEDFAEELGLKRRASECCKRPEPNGRGG